MVRRRRAIGRVLTGVLGLVLVGGAVSGMVFLAARDKPFDYGVDSAAVRLLVERNAAEPCDRTVALKLTETMLRAHDHRGTLKKIDEFNARCGEWSRLGWVSYAAHMRLGEHDAAVADASKLIALNANDKDFWWWRAQAQEERGHLDEAVADYRKALEVEPALTGIPFNLANVLERQGKLCEARQPILQFLSYHPDVRERDRVEARLSRLAGDGHCPR
jgi:tetratricopeptide (TPR) repeat protein